MDKVNDLASPALAPDATTGDYLRAADPDPDVRRAIAERQDLPEDLVALLAADAYWGVRHAVAGRPSLPEDLWRPHAN